MPVFQQTMQQMEDAWCAHQQYQRRWEKNEMNLSELDYHRIEEALNNSRTVLSRMKQKMLKGKALEHMLVLERAVQALESFVLMY